MLKPHCVTDGIYRLLRAKDRPRSDGTLTLAEARAAPPGETGEAARFLLRLMERFDMCFPLARGAGRQAAAEVAGPGVIDQFQPAGVTADWRKAGGVRLRHVYVRPTCRCPMEEYSWKGGFVPLLILL